MFLTVLKIGGLAVEYKLENGTATTVAELKRMVQDEHLPAKDFRLVYEGRTLRERASLKRCGVRGGDTVEMAMRLRGGRFTAFGFRFPSLKNGEKKKFTSSAPSYRILNWGLNLEACCTNEECIAYKKAVWCPFGFSSSAKKKDAKDAGFNMGVLIHKMKCPACKSALPHDSLIACGFNKCCHSYQGYQQGNSAVIEGSGKVTYEDGFEYHDGVVDGRMWTALMIYVSPL